MAITTIEKNLSETERETIINKLQRIRGRVDGLVRMMEDERACEDVLMQISATYEALRIVSKSMIRQSIEAAIETGLMSTNSHKRDEGYVKLLDTLYKYIK